MAGVTTFDYRDYMNGSLVNVYFNSFEFFPHILQQQFTLIDFISYTGGALGLFLGFSVLSFVEILYYFSVRVVCFRLTKRKVSSSGKMDGKKSKADKSRKFLLSFYQNSSIHGLNQMSLSHRHVCERFCIHCYSI
jgi:Amiloride-sensitive sodium channel